MKIDIIHTNDIHSRVLVLPKVSHLINKVKASNPRSFAFDSGDFITGTIYFTKYQGKIEAELLKRINYDCVTLGNHEFDLPHDQLATYLNRHGKSIVNSNLLLKNDKRYEKLENFNRYKVIDKDGLKVGVVGATSRCMSYHFSSDNNVVKPEIEYIVKAVEQVKQLGCDLVIAINHLGYELDKQLAAATDDLDIILGAHSHTKLDAPQVINSTLILQTGCMGAHVGHLTVDYDDGCLTIDDYKLIDLENYTEEDQKIGQLLQPYKQEMEPYKEVVGISKTYLTADRSQITVKQIPLGKLVCDSFLDAAQAKGIEADFGLINGRGIRAPIAAGPVSVEQVYDLLPFDKQVVVVELTGQQLIEECNTDFAQYLQTSGVEISYEKPVTITINNQPIDLQRTYKVVTNTYVASPVAYPNIAKAKVLATLGQDIDVVCSYIKSLDQPFEIK